MVVRAKQKPARPLQGRPCRNAGSLSSGRGAAAAAQNSEPPGPARPAALRVVPLPAAAPPPLPVQDSDPPPRNTATDALPVDAGTPEHLTLVSATSSSTDLMALPTAPAGQAAPGVLVSQEVPDAGEGTGEQRWESYPVHLSEAQLARIQANRERAKRLRADRERVRGGRQAAAAGATVTEMSTGVPPDEAAGATVTQPSTGAPPDEAAGATVTQPSTGAPPDDADGAATRATSSGGAEERPMCVICQDLMMPEQSRLAMLCGHAFHEECVRKYATCKQIPLEEACPMRCHRSANDMQLHVTTDEMRGEPAATTPQASDDEFQGLVEGALQNAAGVS